MSLLEVARWDPEQPFEYRGVCYDPRDGSGATPNQATITYRGFVTFMTPDEFLRLVLPLGEGRGSKDFFREQLPKGWCVAPPQLFLSKTRGGWGVSGHEGRNRATALKALGAEKIPVYVQSCDWKHIAHEVEAFSAPSRAVEKLLPEWVVVQTEDKRSWRELPRDIVVIRGVVYWRNGTEALLPAVRRAWSTRGPKPIATMRAPGERGGSTRRNPLRIKSNAHARSYGQAVADAYLAAPSYDEKEVWRWKKLAKHIDKLFKRLPVEVRFVRGQPYANERELQDKVARTGVLLISTDHNKHPVFTPKQNLHFRAVHDYFTHIARDQGFGLRGELAAYNTHARLAPPDTLPALFTEVAGQASVAVAKGFFPEQKIAVLPFDPVQVGVEVAPIAGRPGVKRWRRAPKRNPLSATPGRGASRERSRSILQRIPARLAAKIERAYKIDGPPFACGADACAWRAPGKRVVKLTTSRGDANVAALVQQTRPAGLARVFDVRVLNTRPTTYLIVTEFVRKPGGPLLDALGGLYAATNYDGDKLTYEGVSKGRIRQVRETIVRWLGKRAGTKAHRAAAKAFNQLLDFAEQTGAWVGFDAHRDNWGLNAQGSPVVFDFGRTIPPRTKLKRMNPDDRLRRLERAAAAGDPEASERLSHERGRAGRQKHLPEKWHQPAEIPEAWLALLGPHEFSSDVDTLDSHDTAGDPPIEARLIRGSENTYILLTSDPDGAEEPEAYLEHAHDGQVVRMGPWRLHSAPASSRTVRIRLVP